MFTLRIQGLCLCVHEAKQLSIYMLNSAYDPKNRLPYHLQTLVVEKSAVVKSSGGELLSLLGRMRNSNTPLDDDGKFIGWDLGGKTVSIGDGSGVPALVTSAVAAGTEHPANAADFTDPYWTLDVARLSPGASIEAEAMTLGKRTNAVVAITGGVSNSGTPQNGDDANWVWDFGTFKQAVTDTLTVEWSSPPTVEISQGAVKVGEIELASGEGHLVNEASQIDNENDQEVHELGGIVEPARHLVGYRQALTKFPAALPRKDYEWSGQGGILEGTFCIILRG